MIVLHYTDRDVSELRVSERDAQKAALLPSDSCGRNPDNAHGVYGFHGPGASADQKHTRDHTCYHRKSVRTVWSTWELRVVNHANQLWPV